MGLRKSKIRTTDDLDPMSSVSNMTDVMLVLAVGFLIFAMMATGSTEISQEKIQQNVEQSQQQTTELDSSTTELNDQPEDIQSSGSGYHEMGTVYQDPETGKMVMVSS